jgi:hypothetical protein
LQKDLESLNCVRSDPERQCSTAPEGQRHLFDVILHRSHCRQDPTWQARPGGEYWDALKPLQLHGLDLSRTIIIDKSKQKIVPEEQKVLVVLPEWDGTAAFRKRESENVADIDRNQLPLMLIVTKLLLKHLGPGSGIQDTAEAVPFIQAALLEVCHQHCPILWL